MRGFAVQAANPKALAFFVALLPQFIDAHGSVPEQVAILAVTSVLIEYVVQAAYVWVATRAGALAGFGWTTWLHACRGRVARRGRRAARHRANGVATQMSDALTRRDFVAAALASGAALSALGSGGATAQEAPRAAARAGGVPGHERPERAVHPRGRSWLR